MPAPFFDGQVGCYPHTKKIKLNLPLDAQLIQKKPSPLQSRHKIAFKKEKEMEEMVDDGILRRNTGRIRVGFTHIVVFRKDTRIRIVPTLHHTNREVPSRRRWLMMGSSGRNMGGQSGLCQHLWFLQRTHRSG